MSKKQYSDVKQHRKPFQALEQWFPFIMIATRVAAELLSKWLNPQPLAPCQ